VSAYTAVPSPRQLEYQDWEFGIFLHVGIRTFFEGHRDWDGQPMPATAFRPSELDCDQWVRTAKRAGARYMVLTAKHHDGFANWPSATTDYSVAAAPWRDGHGDLVREFIDACRRHDMRIGIYYSPAEWHCPFFDDEKRYDEYLLTQLTELLGGYGDIDILWFDGCGSAGHTYDWARIIPELRRLQPDALVFNLGEPDYRWVGNEAGIAPAPCWNTVTRVPVAVDTDAAAPVGSEPVWLPAECDCRIRARNWFYSDHDADTLKTLTELLGLYDYSVGRGCNLLLNVAPDRRGLLPDADTARLLEFGTELRRRFSAPVAQLADATEHGDCWQVALAPAQLVNRAVLQENLTRGEHVRAFTIAVQPGAAAEWIDVWRGTSLGHKAICTFPPVRAHAVRVTVECAPGRARLRAWDVFAAGTTA